MKKISLYFLLFSVLIISVWAIPWAINFASIGNGHRSPFTVYSSVIDDFAVINFDESDNIRYTDAAGSEYSEAQFDSILPFFYFRQLMQDGRLPKQIKGVRITPQLVNRENFYFTHSPKDINIPKIGLSYLLESMSGRVDLEMPNDIFRFTNTGIEFIDTETQAINQQKSDEFTAMLLRKGVVFPIFTQHGVPSTRKEYDLGFVLLDANRKLFHLKMTKGLPYVRAIETPADVRLEHLFITEFSNRKTLAFAVCEDNFFYVVKTATYEVIKTGVPSFDPTCNAMRIMGNVLDWTVRVASDNVEYYYALDANDYSLIDSVSYTHDSFSMPGLHFTDYNDEFVRPRF